MNICIVGAGHVGLVTGACFADLGHRVTCLDNNRQKIQLLKRGGMPIYEPGLEELVRRNRHQGRLRFSDDLSESVSQAEVIFIAVGTPPKESGEADLTYVENVARQIATVMRAYKLVVEKSTVPVETGEWIKRTIQAYRKRRVPFDVASNPEFLREGSAVQDFLHPDRIVIGVESQRAKALLLELYKPIKVPVVVTDIKSAELIKHASNSFLATKISFINAIATICEMVGADVLKVSEGMGLDRRIGPSFLAAGVGYGGSCFPKDIDAFIHIAGKAGYEFDLLKAVREINEAQKRRLVQKIERALWILNDKTVGVLGLAFKPDTDDLRNAPSLDIIARLQQAGATVKAFDPQAMPHAKALLPNVRFCTTAYEAARGSDCLVILTEWNEFKELDFARLKRLLRQPVVVDGRNIYDPKKLARLGFRYVGMGR